MIYSTETHNTSHSGKPKQTAESRHMINGDVHALGCSCCLQQPLLCVITASYPQPLGFCTVEVDFKRQMSRTTGQFR